GLEYARGLGEFGVKVVLADIADAGPAAEQLKQEGITAMSEHADVTDEDSLAAAVERTLTEFGGIDILVNNAAIYGTMQKKSWAELSFTDWDAMLRVNVTGSFL